MKVSTPASTDNRAMRLFVESYFICSLSTRKMALYKYSYFVQTWYVFDKSLLYKMSFFDILQYLPIEFRINACSNIIRRL